MSITGETKVGHTLPPINTELRAASPQLENQNLTSPILRDFDRYPLSNNQRASETTTNNSVTKIMMTATSRESSSNFNMLGRRSSRSSVSSNVSDRRLTRKFQKGQLQISSPEGFKHVSSQTHVPIAIDAYNLGGGGANSNNSSRRGSEATTSASLPPTDDHYAGRKMAAAASTPPPLPTTPSSFNNSPDLTSAASNKSPPIPPPPSSQGPPVKSYRESMALRSGVLLEPSSAKESRFSKALGTPPGQRRTSQNDHQLQQPQNQDQNQAQAQSPNPSLNSQNQGPNSNPRPQSQSSRDSKRISRFPWKRSSEKTPPPPPPSLPNISEPVLEYSTSELIHEGRASNSSLPLSEYYPNGPPGHENLSGENSRQQPHQHQNQNQQPIQNHVSNGSRSSSSQISPTTHTRQFSQKSLSSNGDTGKLRESPLSKTETPAVSTNATSPTTVSSPGPIHYEMQPTPPPQLPPSQTDLEIAKWRQKCRDSDDKRRALMVDYQQKLDAERKKNMELEKKLEKLIRDKAANAASAVAFSTGPKANTELTNKVKALEGQRKALKDALQNVRETKDLEIAEYRSMLSKVKKKPDSRGKVMDDSSSGTSTLSKNERTDTFGTTRMGINPLLPTAGPVDVKSYDAHD